MKFVIIIFSFLLSLGLLSETYFPFVKEAAIGLIAFHVIFKSKSFSILLEKLTESIPLWIIFLILLLLGSFLPFSLAEESVFNSKFLLAISLFIFLSAFFSIYPQYIKHSLIFFGIGGGIMSIMFSFGLFDSSFFEIRNDRLIFLKENPNSLSVRVSLGILFLIWGALENKLKLSSFGRICLVIPVPFMFNLVLATGSKGSFLLCLGSIVCYILLVKNLSKTMKRKVIVLGIVALFFAVSLFFESSVYERFMTGNLTSGRNEIWESAFNIFYNHPFGVGEVGYQVLISKLIGIDIDTHNLFIYLLVTGGFLSLLVFIYFLLMMLKRIVLTYKEEKNAIFLIIFVSMIFVMSKTGGVLTYLIMWYFFACISGSSYKKTFLTK